jgi:ABC-type dipeptide/oligopeptide/nickel transport system permease component
LIVRRVGSALFILAGISFLTFLAGHLAPGDPIQLLMGNRHDAAEHARLMHYYHLDDGWYVQYGRFVAGALRGDLGQSFAQLGTPVTTIVARTLPVSLEVGGLALLLTLAIGIPAGVMAALRRGTWGDPATMGVLLVLYAVPSFVLVPLVIGIDITLYEHGLPSLPVEGWGTPAQLVMPLIVYVAGGVAYIGRLTRASVLEVIDREYVRTAKAKGLRPYRVTVRHVLRNGLIPVVTYIGPAVAFLVTGSFVIEYFFNIPGIALQTVQSLFQRDYPVVQGTTLLLATAVVAMNLVTDLAYMLLDPRIEGVSRT